MGGICKRQNMKVEINVNGIDVENAIKLTYLENNSDNVWHHGLKIRNKNSKQKKQNNQLNILLNAQMLKFDLTYPLCDV